VSVVTASSLSSSSVSSVKPPSNPEKARFSAEKILAGQKKKAEQLKNIKANAQKRAKKSRSNSLKSSYDGTTERKSMEVNIEKWDIFHEEMIKKAHTLIPQGEAGKQGLAEINALEKRFLKAYNQYIGAYNVFIRFTPDLLNVWNETGKASGIEKLTFSEAFKEIISVEKAFEELPDIWY
jgi:hypothetical protein